MTEATVIRYLIAKGWKAMGEGWFCLRGFCDQPVCIETAFHMQKCREQQSVAA